MGSRRWFFLLFLIPIKNQSLSVGSSQVQQARDHLAEQISRRQKAHRSWGRGQTEQPPVVTVIRTDQGEQSSVRSEEAPCHDSARALLTGDLEQEKYLSTLAISEGCWQTSAGGAVSAEICIHHDRRTLLFRPHF